VELGTVAHAYGNMEGALPAELAHEFRAEHADV
jgi:hypothetical protein